MIWRSEGTERTQRSGGMVINPLAVAASLWSTKDVAVIPKLDEKHTKTVLIVEGKTPNVCGPCILRIGAICAAATM